MEKILKEIARILDFNDSFFEEVESLGKLGFYETDLISGTFKASANYRRLFNLPEKGMYDIKEYQEIVHPDDFLRVYETFNACKKENRNFESDYRVIVKGEVRYFRGKSIFIPGENGAAVKVVGMKQDVTEEKLAEIEKNKYIRELEHARELTATIVHDLKAPIHNISMIAELLKEDLEEEKESLLKELEKSCQRSYDIIDDVLENTFTDEAAGPIKMEWYNLHKPVNKAVSTFYYTAQKKNIRILTNLQPDVFAFIHPKALQRALENLLSNAIKFSHRNSQVEVSLSEQEDVFLIKIEDSGLGMNESQQASLFHKKNSLRRRGIEGERSSGLGMNIVKKIVNQHGGKISVESQEGQGTTFSIELPKQ